MTVVTLDLDLIVNIDISWRLEILRRGLGAALKDPELLAEANKAKLIITSVPGQKVEKHVNKVLSMPPHVKESLKFLVRKKKKS